MCTFILKYHILVSYLPEGNITTHYYIHGCTCVYSYYIVTVNVVHMCMNVWPHTYIHVCMYVCVKYNPTDY